MGAVTWHKNLSVGIDSIDDQHKELIRIINALYELIAKESAPRQLQAILKDLQEYTVTHFSNEEKYFQRFGYPEAPAHIKQHKVFIGKIDEFRRGLDSTTYTLTFEMMDFLQNWLVHHIMKIDKQYTSFFVKHGVI